MTAYRLTVLAGDGTGPEVIAEALRVIEAFQQHSPVSFEITEIPCGGQYYLETGEEWPEGSFEHCRDNSDAILLGQSAGQTPDFQMAIWRVAKLFLDLGADSNYTLMSAPNKLYPGVKHKVHGVPQQVWQPEWLNGYDSREYRRPLPLSST
ncbi:MAG: hypothetical protein Ct9H90mP14_1100 [Methanobacteriota archaeon]|nr:MAG: hypothetical protein Ct9H90mP14_1100 [Euryarchaeota archaeon]